MCSTLTLGGNMFLYQNGEMWNSVMSVQYALTPIGPNDGGFCCIPGSHKSNFECPAELRDCAVEMPGLIQPVLAPGDMLLFTEALTSVRIAPLT
jgi:ectoine hydroxylase-related dioxygenase (phytanoyl-CoA dioxygenase family)